MIKSERFISRLKAIVPLVGLFWLIADMKPARAQIAPDNTLGSESSQINSIEDLRTAIEGGAIRGDNLFHSFQEFSIREGSTVNFANPDGITNIFSRVTGSNISEIFGSLGVNGNANLFFINPNGIVFGENSVIDIGGSFMATTAQEIQFESGDTFSAANPNTPKITINFPIGLGFGNNSGAIEVNGRGHSLFLPVSEPELTIKNSELPGLGVNRRENVALIGGEINFDGGVLIAEEGAIELGGIKSGIVQFDIDAWQFDYSDVSTFGDVNLSNTSWIDITNRSLLNDNSSNVGVEIQGRNIVIKDESTILSQNFTVSEIKGINLNATDSIIISKVRIDPIPTIPGGAVSETTTNGIGGDISLNSSKISLVDGGSVISRTVESGKAGDIEVNASNQLELVVQQA